MSLACGTVERVSALPARATTWVDGSEPRRRRRLGFLLLSLGLATLSWLALGQRYSLTVVVGTSMMPTYRGGNILIVDRTAYRQRDPARDEVVIVRLGEELLVKRVVGLPGEEVEVQHGRLRIGGRPWPESHLIEPGQLVISKGRLGPGKYAVLGDNRSMEPYQMVHAVIPREGFVGRVVFP